MLAAVQERLERKYALAAKGANLDYAAERVAGLMNMDACELFEPGKQRRRVQARSVLCYWTDIFVAQSCEHAIVTNNMS